MGRRKAPKAHRPSAREDRTTRGLLQARSSLEPSAVSNHTRPMSWLGPASSGAHPRTKGARFCAGGHRHRIPLTTKGLRVARATWQTIRGPFAEAEKMQISRTRRKRFAEELPSGPAAGDGWAGRAHGRRRRCALGVPQGVRDTGHAADGGHGSRGMGSVRSPCGRYCAGARHHAWTRRFRPAACLCSRGSDCTTRMGRSCRCAGASVRRTADKPAPGEP